jgi:hypothetical protein
VVVFFLPRCFPSYSLLVFRTNKNGGEGGIVTII